MSIIPTNKSTLLGDFLTKKVHSLVAFVVKKSILVYFLMGKTEIFKYKKAPLKVSIKFTLMGRKKLKLHSKSVLIVIFFFEFVMKYNLKIFSYCSFCGKKSVFSRFQPVLVGLGWKSQFKLILTLVF